MRGPRNEPLHPPERRELAAFDVELDHVDGALDHVVAAHDVDVDALRSRDRLDQAARLAARVEVGTARTLAERGGMDLDALGDAVRGQILVQRLVHGGVRLEDVHPSGRPCGPRRVHGDEAEVGPALEHGPPGRHRLREQSHEGLLASLLQQLANVVQVRELGAGEPDSVHVELEALERTSDERRRPVDERAQAEPPCPGRRLFETGKYCQLRPHEPIPYADPGHEPFDLDDTRPRRAPPRVR